MHQLLWFWSIQPQSREFAFIRLRGGCSSVREVVVLELGAALRSGRRLMNLRSVASMKAGRHVWGRWGLRKNCWLFTPWTCFSLQPLFAALISLLSGSSTFPRLTNKSKAETNPCPICGTTGFRISSLANSNCLWTLERLRVIISIIWWSEKSMQ